MRPVCRCGAAAPSQTLGGNRHKGPAACGLANLPSLGDGSELPPKTSMPRNKSPQKTRPELNRYSASNSAVSEGYFRPIVLRASWTNAKSTESARNFNRGALRNLRIVSPGAFAKFNKYHNFVLVCKNSRTGSLFCRTLLLRRLIIHVSK